MALSKAMMIRKLMESCDVRLFVGDLMHGGDYDLLEPRDSPVLGFEPPTPNLSLEEDVVEPKGGGVARKLIPLWGIDAWVPGNHELGTEMDILAILNEDSVRADSNDDGQSGDGGQGGDGHSGLGSEGGGSEFRQTSDDIPILCSNLQLSDKASDRLRKKLRIKPWVRLERNEVPICLYGVVREELIDSDLYETTSPVEGFLDAYYSSKPSCEGALTIVLSHSGWKEDEEFIREVEARSEHVDVVLGAHSHNISPEPYPWVFDNGTILSHIGSYGGWVGVLDLVSFSDPEWRSWSAMPWAAAPTHRLFPWVLGHRTMRVSTHYTILNDTRLGLDPNHLARAVADDLVRLAETPVLGTGGEPMAADAPRASGLTEGRALASPKRSNANIPIRGDPTRGDPGRSDPGRGDLANGQVSRMFDDQVVETWSMLREPAWEDEREHGIMLTHLRSTMNFRRSNMHSHGMDLFRTAPPRHNVAVSVNTGVVKAVPLSPDVFSQLCEEDHRLLNRHRSDLTNLISKMTQTTVALLPENMVSEEAIACRFGQCMLGKWLGGVLRFSPTVAAREVKMECAPDVLLEAVEAVSKRDEAASNTVAAGRKRSLSEIRTVLGMIQGGILRGGLPPRCESVFEQRAGGCSLTASDRTVDLYDVNRILPFHNKVRIVVLKNLHSLCHILTRAVWQWNTHNGSHPGLVHFGGLDYFIRSNNTILQDDPQTQTDLSQTDSLTSASASMLSEGTKQHFESPPAVYKGRQPLFDPLWTLKNKELIGIRFSSIRGDRVEGVCVSEGNTSEEGPPRTKWRCRGRDCTKPSGKILLVTTDLLVKGADGGILRWADDVDLDYMRQVANQSAEEAAQDDPDQDQDEDRLEGASRNEHDLGCWFRGLENLTINDAAVLFLDTSITTTKSLYRTKTKPLKTADQTANLRNVQQDLRNSDTGIALSLEGGAQQPADSAVLEDADPGPGNGAVPEAAPVPDVASVPEVAPVVVLDSAVEGVSRKVKSEIQSGDIGAAVLADEEEEGDS
ncbi:hypothetical protein GNI_014690 [Gregarina niphandrodes]|uniref:Calcineurin-like phosphoesterase domain-containing protein n=1 Tax=Gregarina niphandrodes TaxID=110365 RepID=A0A023BCG1_GRENI|nr:hypothetical protein GNI_014690 [Gregarina niphandrodes]EZG83579.1 hypothetical protein GNI_014690 [Gregarina niphandrodes]|eukprot:XP_011128940.1 hypothetical protein GNI_014690 [Gregarina niphandrodes]